MEFNYKEEYLYPTNILLNMTDNCNLKCKYCFVTQSPHYMTLDIAKKAIDWAYKNLEFIKQNNLNNGIKENNLTFFGGEPMLCFDSIIKPLIEYIKEKKYNTFNYSITTNGTLLNEERLKFLYDNKINILLSIDGNEITQNYNRPCKDKTKNSFDLVMKNIPILLDYFPYTTFRATIYENTCQYLFENYLFAQTIGFKKAFFIPDSRGKWKQKNIEILKEQLQKITLYEINEFLNNRNPLLLNSQRELFTKILSKDQLQPSIRRCGLGMTTVSIGYNGDIYGCQEQDSHGKNSIFYIGNLNLGIDKNKHKRLLTKYNNSILLQQNENNDLCDSCFFKNKCNIIHCPSSQYDLYNNFFVNSELSCIWIQELLKSCLLLIEFLIIKNDNKLFKQFLENLLKEKRGDKNGM